MLDPVSPWALSMVAGKTDGRSPPGCTFCEIRPKTYLEVLAPSGVERRDILSCLNELGLDLAELQSQDLRGDDELMLATIAPDRFIIIARQITDRQMASLQTTCVVTDQSHARCGIRLSGMVTPVVRKGLSIDLSLDALPPMRATQTNFHGMTVLVLRRASEAFDLYISRSFAVSFWDALSDAALEEGWACTEPCL
jgi:methylglutamate dehydrogenase subunit D